jgi:hypothetical protein
MVSEDSRSLASGPFLLIVRTRRIFTAGDSPASSAGYSEFPAYGQMLTALLPARGAAFPTLGSYPSRRREDWTISSSRGGDVRRMASEDSRKHIVERP